MVLSVAGGNPDPTGYIYQIGIHVFRDGSVVCPPQIWHGSNMTWYTQLSVGEYDYITWCYLRKSYL